MTTPPEGGPPVGWSGSQGGTPPWSPVPPGAEGYPPPYPHQWGVPPASPTGAYSATWGAPPSPATPHERPLPYHQVLRTRTYRAWRPAVGLLILVVVLLVAMSLIVAGSILVDFVLTGDDLERVLDRFTTDITPLSLLATNLSIAVAIPVAMLALLVAHRLRPGWLGSVVGRLRWGLMGRFGVLALAVMGGSILLSFLLPADESTGTAGEIELASFQTWLAFATVVLLTTPLQAAGEEYVFRGYGFQALGAWFRTPVPGAVVTSMLFAFAHGGQNPWLFADRFAFGLIACWLVVRTGGLEAAIALHAAYNAVSFLLAAALGQVSDTLTTTDIPWWYAAFDVARLLVFAWLAVRIADRHQVARLTASG